MKAKEMISSNLAKFDKLISINHPKIGEPRKILTEILNNVEDEFCLISLIFVGRRVIDQTNVKLLTGRRHRKYFALKVRKKKYIQFGWHKLKNLNEQEQKFIEENFHLDIFSENGKHLVLKSGGTIWPEALLYNKIKLNTQNIHSKT